MKKVLVLAPHTDDGELGCGATISRLIKNGAEIYYAAFSSCRDSLPESEEPDVLVKEMKAATTLLGIPGENIIMFDYQVRHFEEHRQEILDDLINLERRIKPDVVFSPSKHDIHQDHMTIAAECLRAFKKTTILQYELPWNNYSFDNQFFYIVKEEDVQQKIKAIACYKSQVDRAYVSSEFIKGNLITHGIQIGVKYAEVFETPRIIMREQFDLI